MQRPGSRASSRASSRADWCVSPNVYHREEVDDPSSNRKYTRVVVTCLYEATFSAPFVVIACCCVAYVQKHIFVLLLIVAGA